MQKQIALAWLAPLARCAALTVAALLAVTGCKDEQTNPKPPLVCGGGLVDCGGQCIDLMSNPDHCGSCTIDCLSTQVCSVGNCTLACHPGLLSCDRACVSVGANNQHCGSCGNACAQGEVCSDGECAASCRSGLEACSVGCVSTASDHSNCGACETVCPAGYVCSLGACEQTCNSGLNECGGGCVDFHSDPANCGGCGIACGQGFLCDGGSCRATCQDGLDVCDGECVDTAHDPRHCGGCDRACPTRDHAMSFCYPENSGTPECGITCDPGYHNCDGNNENGCEVSESELQNDMNNCGACGIQCNSTLVDDKGTPLGTAEVCMAGRCWGNPYGRRTCQANGGTLEVIDACKNYMSSEEAIVSTCCEFDNKCAASAMAPVLACRCQGTEKCFGWAGATAWGCFAADELVDREPFCNMP